MLQLTDQNFEIEVLKANELVLVDFWAPWCMPCRMTEPMVEALAKEYEGKPVKIAKVNVDDNQRTPANYGIMSIPTFLVFKNGQVVEQVVGAVSKEVMRGKIEKHV